MTCFNRRLSSFIASICSALLSLIGFSCCSPEDAPEMYGMPIGDFEIKGSVTTEDGTPIKDAEVRVTGSDIPSGVFSFENTSTDAKGNYEIEAREFIDNVKVVCIPKNPDLQSDSVIVRLKYKGGDGGWYIGHAEETVNFKLKENKQEE